MLYDITLCQIFIYYLNQAKEDQIDAGEKKLDEMQAQNDNNNNNDNDDDNDHHNNNNDNNNNNNNSNR